ncbi:MAG: hypothetical protein ABL903_08625 [Methylococcales bacterium]
MARTGTIYHNKDKTIAKPDPLPWQSYSSPVIGKYQRMIDPASLPKDQKRALWEGIKMTDPALADLIVNNRDIALLKAVFSAAVVFTEAQINRYMVADRPK